MMHAKINSRIPFLITLAVTILGASFFGFGQKAIAATPPLTPGCYVRSSGADGAANYDPATCSTENMQRSIAAPYNKCFVAPGSNQGVGSFSEVNCSTGGSASNNVDGSSLGSVECSSATVNDNSACKDVAPVDITLNPAGDCEEGTNCIRDLVQKLVNAASIGVGVIVTIMIIIAGFQYITSRDNPQQVQAAKTKIVNAVIALVAYIFIFGFLQWIIPGGIFSSTISPILIKEVLPL
jgi:hypothetical protein